MRGDGTEYGLIADPAMATALRAGRKTQSRVGLHSPLAHCVAGDRLWVREACLMARHDAGQDLVTTSRKAEFAIFPDGWRQFRDGGGQPGQRPGKGDYQGVGARHMPRWAARTSLIVAWVRRERLQQISPADIRASGARPVAGGLLWRWPKPIPGLHLTARRAFATNWNINHPTPGERWEDNPEIVVLGFRVETIDTGRIASDGSFRRIARAG